MNVDELRPCFAAAPAPAEIAGPDDDEADLTHSGLDAIPHLNYPKLKKLELRRNLLRSLPDSLDLGSLETLDLYDNLLDEIPGQLIRLPNLRSLDLSFNRIRVLSPAPIPRSLERLYLSSNLIDSVAEFVSRGGEFGSLRILELGANGLGQLPKRWSFPALEQLWLGRNRLEVVEADFSGLVHLQILSLQCNRLKGVFSLAADPQNGCLCIPAGIEELYLSENELTSLGFRTPSQRVPSLRLLDIGGNKFEALSDELPARFPNIEELWCNNNNLSDLADAIERLSLFPRLTSLFLARNPCASKPGHAVKIKAALPRLVSLDAEYV